MTKTPQSSNHPIIHSSLNGWIILDKPSGITSAHAVAKVKRILTSPSPLVGEGGVGGKLRTPEQASTPLPNPPPQGGRGKKEIKIGHAGTLDPLASGVLPLALGEATKTIPYMMDAPKAYEFTVSWGEERDTDDSQGKVTETSDKRPTVVEINAILPQFTGKILQTPPAYSAIKVQGERAYDLARAGEEVQLKAREVKVYELGVKREAWDVEREENARITSVPRSTAFTCHCSKGTYIRSLARDMGRILGCFGHISTLRRIKVGKFGENHAISLEGLEKEVYKSGLGFLLAIESALDDIPAVNVDESQAAQLKRGQNVVLPLNAVSTTMIAGCNGRLIAICEWDSGQLRPKRVFNL